MSSMAARIHPSRLSLFVRIAGSSSFTVTFSKNKSIGALIPPSARIRLISSSVVEPGWLRTERMASCSSASAVSFSSFRSTAPSYLVLSFFSSAARILPARRYPARRPFPSSWPRNAASVSASLKRWSRSSDHASSLRNNALTISWPIPRSRNQTRNLS